MTGIQRDSKVLDIDKEVLMIKTYVVLAICLLTSLIALADRQTEHQGLKLSHKYSKPILDAILGADFEKHIIADSDLDIQIKGSVSDDNPLEAALTAEEDKTCSLIILLNRKNQTKRSKEVHVSMSGIRVDYLNRFQAAPGEAEKEEGRSLGAVTNDRITIKLNQTFFKQNEELIQNAIQHCVGYRSSKVGETFTSPRNQYGYKSFKRTPGKYIPATIFTETPTKIDEYPRGLEGYGY